MKLQSLNNGYAIRTLSPKPNCSTKLKLPATVQSCAPEQDLRGQSIALVGLGKFVRAVAMLALAKGASVFALDQNPNLRLLEGKQVMSELDFAAKILPKSVKILAVTGTNGKSTVVTFAGQVDA